MIKLYYAYIFESHLFYSSFKYVEKVLFKVYLKVYNVA